MHRRMRVRLASVAGVLMQPLMTHAEGLTLPPVAAPGLVQPLPEVLLLLVVEQNLIVLFAQLAARPVEIEAEQRHTHDGQLQPRLRRLPLAVRPSRC